jgi:L-arabinokinase
LPTIVFYISGHGFGHASRDIEVINAILARRDDVRVIARTAAPRWLFEQTILPANTDRFMRDEIETDTGVVQIDSLHPDERETVIRARAFMDTFDERVDAEVSFLRQRSADLVVADIPPLGIAAAKRAGVRAVGLSNFTWDWIYSGYRDADDVVRRISDVYSTADAALRLPMYGGFQSMHHITDLPFVARRAATAPSDTKRLLNLPPDRRLVLVSFGGYGLNGLDDDALSRVDGYTIIGSRRFPLDEAAMYAAGLRYEDVVRAADIVVTKPGYGIISECVANDTALLYTSRGRFLEYDVLVREMPRFARARFISHDDLFAGCWTPHLDALLAQPAPLERPPVNGADVAAHLLLDMI